MSFTEWLNILLPYIQGFVKSVWSTVPTGVGTAVGSYFGTKHVVARLEKLSKKNKKKRVKQK